MISMPLEMTLKWTLMTIIAEITVLQSNMLIVSLVKYLIPIGYAPIRHKTFLSVLKVAQMVIPSKKDVFVKNRLARGITRVISAPLPPVVT